MLKSRVARDFFWFCGKIAVASRFCCGLFSVRVLIGKTAFATRPRFTRNSQLTREKVAILKNFVFTIWNELRCCETLWDTVEISGVLKGSQTTHLKLRDFRGFFSVTDTSAKRTSLFVVCTLLVWLWWLYVFVGRVTTGVRRSTSEDEVGRTRGRQWRLSLWRRYAVKSSLIKVCSCLCSRS